MRKKSLLGIGAMAMLFLLGVTLQAADFCVAQQDPKASDENPGTEAAPWKTIGRSLKGLNAGDTVLIKKGVYREQMLLNPKGRDNFPPVPSGLSYQQMTSFAAFPGDEVVVKGSVILEGIWKHHKDKIWYLENPPEIQTLPIVFCDGKRLETIGDWGGRISEMIKGGAGSVEVWKGRKGEKLEDLEVNSYFYEKDSKRLYVWLADGSDPNSHLMEMTMMGWGLSVEGSYMKISGIKFIHAGTGVAGSFNIMENCAGSDSQWCGGSVSGEYNTLIGCKFNRNGNSGMGGAGRGHRIINCETSYNNYLKIDAGWHSGGCKFIAFCSDWVISGHVAAYNIDCPGIWFDWGNYNVTIENSVLHHNGGGIMIEVSERATIRNNVFYENYARGVYLANSSDCQVLNNVFYHNGLSGVGAVGVARGIGDFGCENDNRAPACNTVVWGNIFVDNCHPDFCPKTLDGRDQPWDTRPELIMPDVHEINTGNISDYNIYYRSPGRPMPFWFGWHITVFDNLADWQEKTGNDKHSIIAKPLFINEAERDFRPAPGSPAIDFVRPRMGGSYEFTGKMRELNRGKDNKPIRWTAGPFPFVQPPEVKK